ncbi:hypothetical protein [Sphingobacterium mizutaii]|uniref:hypothetical protein n=1 Tax=Sphingobacterium mizutaii TaxID=1010 RepID=UPI001626E07B|nr:hypothetical protein [Sphingobacterium mizutaii]
MENNSFNTHIEKFVKYITPKPIEPKQTDSGKMVKWGEDNLYPNFLLELISEGGSAIHGGILSSKGNYVYGGGIIDKNTGEDIGDILVSENDTLSTLLDKIVKDIVLFNAYAIKVTYSVVGTPLHYYHIPMNHLRMNKSRTKFFVNDDWYNNSRTYLSYEKYTPNFSIDNVQPKVFYHEIYSQGVNNVYPSPSFKSAIEDIVTDMTISKLFSNGVSNGFSAGKFITFYGANVDETTKRNATRKFKEVFTGLDGENFMLNWAMNKDTKTEIETIPTDDYGNKVVEIIKKVEKNILSAHNSSSGAIFNVNDGASSLNNGGGEMEMAWSLFKQNYVEKVKKNIVSSLNRLFHSDDRFSKVDIKDKDFVSAKLDMATRQRVFTINELRMMGGGEPIEGGDVFLTSNSNTFTLSPSSGDAFSSLKKKDDDELESRFASAEDYEKVKHLGSIKDEFIVFNSGQFSKSSCGHYHFNSDYKSIEEYLLDNKINDLTIDEATIKIGNELGYEVTKQSVKDALDLLKNSGLIDIKTNTQTNKIWTAPTPIANSTTIEVYYDYTKRPEAIGSIKIPTTRHFCESIIDSNKYFSAKDIMAFSAVLGYDCMQFCGGYWKNKTTGEVNKHCRHQWSPVRVIKK